MKVKLRQILIKTRDEQAEAFKAYCKAHGIKPSIAGRIALARLTARKPTRAEIESATLPLGNPDTLRQNQG